MSLSERQLQMRKSFIGGSEAAAVLGLSRWKTPLQIWGAKTGNLPYNDDLEKSIPARLGTKLEQAVADFFVEETGKQVELLPRDEFGDPVPIFHSVHKFLAVNPDRQVIGENAYLECKTGASSKIHEWEDDQIPIEYIFQCLHTLLCTGAQRVYLAVLLRNNYFSIRTIERDESVLADLCAKECRFWNEFVLKKVMPMPMAKDGGVLNALYPIAEPESCIDLDDEAARICDSLDSLQADYNVLEKEIEEHKNRLRAMLKTFSVGMTDKHKITWNNEKDGRLDTDRLKKEQPGIYDEYKKKDKDGNPATKRVLRVSVRKEWKYGNS